MPNAPILKSTSAQSETFAGVTYHLDGELVPVLTVELTASPIYFEHHVLLWKDPRTTIGIKALAGAFKRIMSGMPVFMTEAHGPGRIAFSRDGAGHLFAIHLSQGHGLDVREHQFLAATDQLDYTFNRVKGVANLLMGGTGFFVDTFTANKGDGILWLHGYGNVFERMLQPGEKILLERGIGSLWSSEQCVATLALGAHIGVAERLEHDAQLSHRHSLGSADVDPSE